MKLTVVGAGAMGGALAAEASAAGHEVHVLDVSRRVIDAINERGLVVNKRGDRLEQRVKATITAADIGVSDVVVIFVKAQHTAAAAQSLGPLLAAQTTVVSLQNGWGNADVLAANADPGRLVFGVTYNSCSLIGPAEIAHTGIGETIVGPYDGTDLTRASQVADLLTDAGWAGRVADDVRTEIWNKLVLNAATLPTAALTGLAAGQLILGDEMRQLVDSAAAEACAVAKSLGLAVDPAELIERIHAVLASAGSGKASMLQDVEARRKTEVEVINGAVVRAAEQNGIDVPANRALVALIHGLERSWMI